MNQPIMEYSGCRKFLKNIFYQTSLFIQARELDQLFYKVLIIQDVAYNHFF